jgi:hypothetical protein
VPTTTLVSTPTYIPHFSLFVALDVDVDHLHTLAVRGVVGAVDVLEDRR